jgi:hypothetical protein
LTFMDITGVEVGRAAGAAGHRHGGGRVKVYRD